MAYRRILSLFLVSLLIAGAARAAELGEPRIASFKGQALVADIELSNLDDPAAPLQVRVASPDVYRGASLSVPPALSSLQLSVVKQGGKQFLHVTSNKPVDTDMLLLFLELGQGANRDVRLATLFLTADPLPPPVAALAPVAPQAPPHPAPPPVVAAPAPAPVLVAKVEPGPELPIHAMAVVSAPLHFAAVSTALPASVRAAPAPSCKASAANQACIVLATKNVALQTKLAGLESKIKLLEATLAPAKPAEAAPKAAAPAPAIVATIASIKPPAEPVPVVVKLAKHKAVEPPPPSRPWLWIAIAAVAALAAVGAIAFLLLRRRAGKVPAAPSGPKPPGIMAGVRNRLMPGKIEPVAE